MSGSACNRGSGFTLLEVMIAVAIMSGIVAVVYATFFTSSRNVEQAEMRRDASDLARTLIAKLSSDITNAHFNPAMRETFFTGRKSGAEQNAPRFDGLGLTTLTNWRRPNTKESELWEVGYWFEETPDREGRVLLRKEKREVSKDSAPLEGGEDFVLTNQVKSLRLRYFNGSTWNDEFDNRSSRAALPKAVEITLVLGDDTHYQTRVEVGWQ